MTQSDEAAGLDKLRQTRRTLKELLEHPGWQAFVAQVGEKQDALIRGLVMKPLAHLDEALEQEYRKGQYAAFDTCVNEPQAWLDNLDLEIERLAAAEAAARKEPANAVAQTDDASESSGRSGRRSP